MIAGARNARGAVRDRTDVSVEPSYDRLVSFKQLLDMRRMVYERERGHAQRSLEKGSHLIHRRYSHEWSLDAGTEAYTDLGFRAETPRTTEHSSWHGRTRHYHATFYLDASRAQRHHREAF